MKQVAGFLILFLFLFAPFLRVDGVTIHLPYYVVAALAAFGLWGGLRERQLLAKAGWLFLGSLVLLLGYGTLVGYLNGYFDKEFYLQVLTGLVVLPAGLGVAVLYRLLFGEKATDNLLWHLFGVGVAHSLIMFVEFAAEPISDFLYSFIPLSEKGLEFVDMRIRSPGLTSGGGDVLSGIHAVLVVIGFYMALRRWHCLNGLQKIMAVVGLYIVVASLALAARTGYVIILGLMPVLFILSTWRTKDRFTFPFLLRGFTGFLLIAGLAFISFSSLLNLLGAERAYKRSAELLESYQEPGKTEVRSVAALKDMYFFPSSGPALIFGTGDLGRNLARGYLPSDVGYVRAIFGFGLIGTFIMYLPFILIGMIVLRREKLEVSQVVLVLCSAAILAMNLKVFYFWGMRDIFKILVVMVFLQSGQRLFRSHLDLYSLRTIKP